MGVWDSVLAGQAAGQGSTDDKAPQYMDLMTALKAKLQGVQLPKDPMERLKLGLGIGQQLKQENEPAPTPNAPIPPATEDDAVPAVVQNQPASDDIGAAAQPTVPSLSSLPRNLASRVKGMQVTSPLASTIPDQYAGYRSSLEDEQGKADNVQDAANTYKGIPQQLNLAPIAAQIDAWTGSKLLSGYKQPESPEERAATLAKLQSMAAGAQQNVTADQLNLLKGSDRDAQMAQTRLLASAMSAGKNSDMPGGVKPEVLDRWTKDFQKDMNLYAQRSTSMGMITGTSLRASKLLTLVDAIPKRNLTGPEMTELGTGMAGLLTGQNRVNFEMVKDLVPQSAQGSINDVISWLTNDPKGRDQQAFVDRLTNTIQREQDLSTQQMHELRRSTIAAHRSLYNADPSRMYQVGNSNGLSSKDIDGSFAPLDPNAPPYQELGGQGPVRAGSIPGRPQAPAGFKGDWNKLSPKAQDLYLQHKGP